MHIIAHYLRVDLLVKKLELFAKQMPIYFLLYQILYEIVLHYVTLPSFFDTQNRSVNTSRRQSLPD